MKRIVGILLASFCVLFAWSARASSCTLKDLESLEEDHPQCLFFIGTQAFRERDYTKAYIAWEKLRTLPDVLPEDESYRTHAYNNLGFLLFMGWGVQPDQGEAETYWQRIYPLGHAEASYHLCHLYGDRKSSRYDRARGLKYCREALLRYAEPGNGAEEIKPQIKRYLAELNKAPRRKAKP